MHEQRPGWGVSVYGSCSVVGPRWCVTKRRDGGLAFLVFLRWLPALVSDCLVGFPAVVCAHRAKRHHFVSTTYIIGPTILQGERLPVPGESACLLPGCR